MAVAAVKRNAAEEVNVNPVHLTQQALSQVDSETLVSMPKEKSLKKAIQRERNKTQPTLPSSFAELEEIPARYRTIDGENWLLHDSGCDDDHRIVLFGHNSALTEMAHSPLWYMDGTFKSRPLIAAQLYVVHFERHENVLFGCAALMMDKTQQAYEAVFNAIKENLPENRRSGPARVSTDFEIQAANAFKDVFPDSMESFCFFHLAQSLWRKAQETGFATLYLSEENTELRAHFHATLALAFVPEEHVVPAFRDLQGAADEALDGVLQLLEYVRGRRRGRGRVDPRFPPKTWNVYQRTVQGIPRTNNSAEAWNRRWNILIGKTHPNIYQFLEALQKEERYSRQQRELVNLGSAPPRKKKRFIDNDDRLVSLLTRFEQTIGEQTNEQDVWKKGYLKFLRAVGHSVRSPFTAWK